MHREKGRNAGRHPSLFLCEGIRNPHSVFFPGLQEGIRLVILQQGFVKLAVILPVFRSK